MTWRLPLRLARREVFRRPGRTALVALLVAVPVAGMTLAVTLIRSEAETPLEAWVQENGQADARVYAEGVPPIELPAGSRSVSFQSTYTRMKDSEGRRADGVISSVPVGDPLTEGMYTVVAGRAATGEGEVVLSSALADKFDAHPGDTLRLERPALGEVDVVGEVESANCLRCSLIVLPGDLRAIDSLSDVYGETLVDLPDTPTARSEARALANQTALTLREDALREAGAEVDSGNAVRWSLVLGAVVLMVVAIVISAAFAVGARRQLVTLGQLSASGASPGTVRTSLILQGTVTGLLGSLVGLGMAVIVLATFRDRIEWLLDQRLRGYEVPVVELLMVVLIGTGAATASALIPARTAAQIPTLAALAGRRPLKPVSRRLIAWGLAGVAAGLALLFISVLGSQSGGSGDVWAFVAIAGGAMELFGACALAPAIVARLEPLSARLRGALRLGARALARHRARTGAVVSAVMAAGALAVVAGALVLGNERQSSNDVELPDDLVVASSERYDDTKGGVSSEPPPPEVQRDLEDTFPTGRSLELRAVEFSGPDAFAFWEPVDLAPEEAPYLGAAWAYVADPSVLEAVRADEEVRAALREHGAVLLTTDAASHDAALRAPNGDEVPIGVVQHRYDLGYRGSLFITEALAEELGARYTAAGTILQLPEPLDAEDRDDLEDLMFSYDDVRDEEVVVVGGVEQHLFLNVTWNQDDGGGPSPFQLELILTGVALVFCLFVIGVSLALAAAEGKDERDILAIAGAPPSLVARSAGARAWLMATIGAAIAVPIGFLPVVVSSWASGRDPHSSGAFPIVFPTRTVGLLLLVVPLVVCAIAWATSSTAQRLRPVRISTATFE